MWDWLAKKATAVSTVILAVITGVYAYLTGKAVGAAEDSAESAAKLVRLGVLPVIHPNGRHHSRNQLWLWAANLQRWSGAGEEPRKTARLPASKKKQLDALQADPPRAICQAQPTKSCRRSSTASAGSP